MYTWRRQVASHANISCFDNLHFPSPGPLYDPRTDVLHFVDIMRNRVYNYHLKHQKLVVHEYDESVSALALRAEGPGVSSPPIPTPTKEIYLRLFFYAQLACIAARGFALLHPPLDETSKGRIEYLATPLNTQQESKTRFNDGACDAKGRFVSGTLAVEGIKGGSLWSYGVNDEGVRLVDDKDISVSGIYAIHGVQTNKISTGLEWPGMGFR